jgi:hypothetical protein
VNIQWLSNFDQEGPKCVSHIGSVEEVSSNQLASSPESQASMHDVFEGR